MNKPFIFNTVIDSSLEKEMNFTLPDIKDSPYKYGDLYVPRVTHILSSMLHEEYLMNWANYMGRIKRIDHKLFTENAANIGTNVHNAIEIYTDTGYVNAFENELNPSNREKMKNGLYSFIKWWDIISTRDIKILMKERELVCEYYGGTLDMLIEIDGLVYLVDFKTSNHLSYKYHLQTAAYRRMLWLVYGILVDGIIILKLSKDNISFEEQFLNLRDYDQLVYVNECERCFISLVNSYYNRLLVENKFKCLK